MGWYRVANVCVEEKEDNERPDGLWSRGGLEGVVVTAGNKWISIPRKALLELIADEIRRNLVDSLEAASPADILKRAGLL